MGVSLYDVSVAQFIQTLGALSGILEKGARFAAANNVDLTEIVDSKVHPTMLPFSFQVVSAVHHSKGAIAAMKSGRATPPGPAASRRPWRPARWCACRCSWATRK